MAAIKEIKAAIRDVADFPKTGVLFRDITPLLGDAEKFAATTNKLIAKFKNLGITKVLGIESRGFILAAPAAVKLKVGFVPVRKKGKLPCKTVSASYQLEYGTDSLEMHEDALKPGEKVLIIDDVLATGGTLQAVTELVRKTGGEIAGIAVLAELKALKGREKLSQYPLVSLIKY